MFLFRIMDGSKCLNLYDILCYNYQLTIEISTNTKQDYNKKFPTGCKANRTLAINLL